MENNFPTESLKAFASFSSSFQGHGSEPDAILILDTLYENFSLSLWKLLGSSICPQCSVMSQWCALVWVCFHPCVSFTWCILAMWWLQFRENFWIYFTDDLFLPIFSALFLPELLLFKRWNFWTCFLSHFPSYCFLLCFLRSSSHYTLQISYCIFNLCYHIFNFQELL